MQNFGVRRPGEQVDDEGFERVPERTGRREPPAYQPGDENRPITDDERAALLLLLSPTSLEAAFGDVGPVTADRLPDLADMAFEVLGTLGYWINTDVVIGKLQRMTTVDREALIAEII